MPKFQSAMIGVSLAFITLVAGCGPSGENEAQAAPSAGTPSATPAVQGAGPRAIQAAIEAATNECRAHGGRFVAEEGFNTRLALNPDEAPDHVLNYGAAECQGADDDYVGAARGGRRDDGCGREGCRFEVFMSGPRGHQNVLSGLIWDIQFVRNVTPARVRFSGSTMPECNASYADGCHAEWGWNGSGFARLRWLQRADMEVIEDQGTQDQVFAQQRNSSQAVPARPASSGNFPPIPKGFYAVNVTCAEAARSADGMYLHLTERSWQEWDGGPDIRSIEATGPDSWRLRTTDGDSLTLRITGPNSFMENGRRFSHCPDSAVPASIRTEYVGNG